MQRLGAIVLCGGRSRRMGRPKEWLPIGGETLLQRVVRLVSSQATLVVVSASEGQALPDLPQSVEVLHDPEPDLGPLQALSTGLDALNGRVAWAYAAASDAPLLQPPWILRLLEFAEGVDLVLPLAEGHYHPLAALYRPEAAAPAASFLLSEGERRLDRLRTVLRSRIVFPEEMAEVDPEFQTLRNINVPDDYDMLLRSLKAYRPSFVDPASKVCHHPRPEEPETRRHLQ